MKIQALKYFENGAVRAEDFKPAGNSITLFGGVGEEITAQRVVNELAEINGDVDINLFSGGGDLFEAAAIFSVIQQRRQKSHVRIFVHGLAASAGAFIAVSGDELIMEENAMLMIHNAWTIAVGNKDDLRDKADLIEKQQQAMVNALAKKSGKDTDEIESMLDEETWMTAAEAIDEGFADGTFEVPEDQRVAAKVDSDIVADYKFKNVPESVKVTGKQKPKNQKSDIMNKALLKACNLSNDADESDVLAFISNLKAEKKALTNQVNTLETDLDDKAEIVSTLKSENDDLKETNQALKESTKQQAVDAVIDEVLEAAGGVKLAEEPKQGLKRRAERYHAETDEDRKADIKEDMIIFAEAKGVKTGNNGFGNMTSVRKNKATVNDEDTPTSGGLSYEQKLMNKIEAVQEQNPDMSFDKARAKAEKILKEESRKGEQPTPHSAAG